MGSRADLLAAASQEPSDPCSVLPGPARLACEGATGVTSGVGGAVSGVVDSARDSAVAGLAQSFAEAGAFFLDKLGDALAATTSVDVGSAWFLERYAVMFGLSAALTLGLLLLAVVKAVIRGQGAEAVRSATLYYLAAVIASSFAPAVVYLLLQLSDRLSEALALGSPEDVDRFLTGTGTLLGNLTVASPGTGSAVVFIAGLVTVLCAGILWVELLLRTAIIYVALLFAAPTFSGLVDRGLWKHSRRWVYFTVSVIFAKPVVVAVLTLAASGAAAGDSADGFTSVFVALALLVVAIFCVGLLFRVIPNAGDEIAGALNARREVNTSTPHSPLPGPSSVVRQSVQSHLVRGSARRAAVPAAAAGAAVPALGGVAAGAAVHRVATAGARAGAAAVTAAAPTSSAGRT